MEELVLNSNGVLMAVSAILFTVATTFICKKLRKRPREEGPSFEPDSKRARLDDTTTSTNDPLAPEVNDPIAPEVVAEPDLLAPEVVPEQEAMVEGVPDWDQVINFDLGNLETSSESESLYYDPFFNDFLQYKELSYNLHQVISDLVDIHPLILPDPHRVTLFEIVRFTFLDEEEENPLFLQEVLQDLMTMGSNSEFFVWFLEGVQNALDFV